MGGDSLWALFYEGAMLRTWVGTQVLMTPGVQRSNWSTTRRMVVRFYRRVLLPPVEYYLCRTEIIIASMIKLIIW